MAVLCALVALAVVCVYRWRKGLRDELLLALQPRYRVLQIDPVGGLMTVEGVNEGFVVRCQDLCHSFMLGGRYAMLYRGNALEIRHQGAVRELEIVEIRVKPPALPGGMA